MSNHLYLIVSARHENLSDVLRDFKKFTSKQIIAAIKANKQESRKDWMLKILREEGEKTAGTVTINSGGRIISLRNYIVQPLLFRK